MSNESGGPAFPFVSNGGITDHQYCDPGMQLRDYFASYCMRAVIGSLNGPVTGEEYPGDFDHYAACAYRMADAMLKARKK